MSWPLDEDSQWGLESAAQAIYGEKHYSGRKTLRGEPQISGESVKREDVEGRVPSKESVEREQFEAFMQRHVAQLNDFAKRYTGRLIPEHREAFLSFALDQAWEQRDELFQRDEDSVQLLRWWDDYCLRPAATSRESWTLRTGWNGSERTTVTGRQLGRMR